MMLLVNGYGNEDSLVIIVNIIKKQKNLTSLARWHTNVYIVQSCETFRMN